MQEVIVKLPPDETRGYTIYVETGAIGKIGQLYDFGHYSGVLVVTDETVKPLLLETLLSALPVKAVSVALPDSDKAKTIDSVQKVWTALQDGGFDRKSLIINFGGGVIGDIGGFAAATYMRGIDFLNVPTTLLAQVDASVGGKTGFNFGGIKNLIGSFSQPTAVVIDPGILATLPEREFLSGFGEIIKQGAIRDKTYFDTVTAKPPREFSEAELGEIIVGSCRIKAAVIQEDETESGARKLLNFGHTIGHAVEALSLETSQPLLHGEAVSIGMAAEAAISQAQHMLPAADSEQLRQALQAAGLPVTVSGMKVEAVLDKMRSDKKNESGGLNFTLIDRLGHALYNQEVPLPVITEALRTILT